MAGIVGRGPRRGEIWQYKFREPNKRRPVVVLTRQQVLPLLSTAIAAPITSTEKGLPSEVPVGTEEGLKHYCAINLDRCANRGQASTARICRHPERRKDAASLSGARLGNRLCIVRVLRATSNRTFRKTASFGECPVGVGAARARGSAGGSGTKRLSVDTFVPSLVPLLAGLRTC